MKPYGSENDHETIDERNASGACPWLAQKHQKKKMLGNSRRHLHIEYTGFPVPQHNQNKLLEYDHSTSSEVPCFPSFFYVFGF
jgi:hypothetical protein